MARFVISVDSLNDDETSQLKLLGLSLKQDDHGSFFEWPVKSKLFSTSATPLSVNKQRQRLYYHGGGEKITLAESTIITKKNGVQVQTTCEDGIDKAVKTHQASNTATNDEMPFNQLTPETLADSVNIAQQQQNQDTSQTALEISVKNAELLLEYMKNDTSEQTEQPIQVLDIDLGLTRFTDEDGCERLSFKEFRKRFGISVAGIAEHQKNKKNEANERSDSKEEKNKLSRITVLPNVILNEVSAATPGTLLQGQHIGDPLHRFIKEYEKLKNEKIGFVSVYSGIRLKISAADEKAYAQKKEALLHYLKNRLGIKAKEVLLPGQLFSGLHDENEADQNALGAQKLYDLHGPLETKVNAYDRLRKIAPQLVFPSQHLKNEAKGKNKLVELPELTEDEIGLLAKKHILNVKKSEKTPGLFRVCINMVELDYFQLSEYITLIKKQLQLVGKETTEIDAQVKSLNATMDKIRNEIDLLDEARAKIEKAIPFDANQYAAINNRIDEALKTLKNTVNQLEKYIHDLITDLPTLKKTEIAKNFERLIQAKKPQPVIYIPQREAHAAKLRLHHQGPASESAVVGKRSNGQLLTTLSLEVLEALIQNIVYSVDLSDSMTVHLDMVARLIEKIFDANNDEYTTHILKTFYSSKDNILQYPELTRVKGDDQTGKDKLVRALKQSSGGGVTPIVYAVTQDYDELKAGERQCFVRITDGGDATLFPMPVVEQKKENKADSNYFNEQLLMPSWLEGAAKTKLLANILEHNKKMDRERKLSSVEIRKIQYTYATQKALKDNPEIADDDAKLEEAVDRIMEDKFNFSMSKKSELLFYNVTGFKNAKKLAREAAERRGVNFSTDVHNVTVGTGQDFLPVAQHETGAVAKRRKEAQACLYSIAEDGDQRTKNCFSLPHPGQLDQTSNLIVTAIAGSEISIATDPGLTFKYDEEGDHIIEVIKSEAARELTAVANIPSLMGAALDMPPKGQSLHYHHIIRTRGHTFVIPIEITAGVLANAKKVSREEEFAFARQELLLILSEDRSTHPEYYQQYFKNRLAILGVREKLKLIYEKIQQNYYPSLANHDKEEHMKFVMRMMKKCDNALLLFTEKDEKTSSKRSEIETLRARKIELEEQLNDWKKTVNELESNFKHIEEKTAKQKQALKDAEQKLALQMIELLKLKKVDLNEKNFSSDINELILLEEILKYRSNLRDHVQYQKFDQLAGRIATILSNIAESARREEVERSREAMTTSCREAGGTNSTERYRRRGQGVRSARVHYYCSGLITLQQDITEKSDELKQAVTSAIAMIKKSDTLNFKTDDIIKEIEAARDFQHCCKDELSKTEKQLDEWQKKGRLVLTDNEEFGNFTQDGLERADTSLQLRLADDIALDCGLLITQAPTPEDENTENLRDLVKTQQHMQARQHELSVDHVFLERKVQATASEQDTLKLAQSALQLEVKTVALSADSAASNLGKAQNELKSDLSEVKTQVANHDEQIKELQSFCKEIKQAIVEIKKDLTLIMSSDEDQEQKWVNEQFKDQKLADFYLIVKNNLTDLLTVNALQVRGRIKVENSTKGSIAKMVAEHLIGIIPLPWMGVLASFVGSAISAVDKNRELAKAKNTEVIHLDHVQQFAYRFTMKFRSQILLCKANNDVAIFASTIQERIVGGLGQLKKKSQDFLKEDMSNEQIAKQLMYCAIKGKASKKLMTCQDKPTTVENLLRGAVTTYRGAFWHDRKKKEKEAAVLAEVNGVTEAYPGEVEQRKLVLFSTLPSAGRFKNKAGLPAPVSEAPDEPESICDVVFH